MRKSDVEGKFKDLMKELLGGADPEEFKKWQSENKKKAELDQAKEHEINTTRDLASTGAEYAKRAAHVIEGDKYKGAGLTAARCIRALAGARGDQVNVKDWVIKKWGDKWLANEIDNAEQKALQTDVETAGGFLIPEDFRASMIALLRNRTVVRGSGVPVLPMRKGQMTIPKQTGAGSAAYVGETKRVDPSQQTFGQISLVGHKLGAITPLSNDLLREADASADLIVRNDLVRVAALKEDLTFLRSDGSSSEPQGLLNWIASGNKFNSAGTSLANKTDDMFDAILQLEENNVDVFDGVWYMSVRTHSNLMRTRDADGRLVFFDEMRAGTLLGWPVFKTNQIPTNLGTGGAESEFYFLETSQAIIADTLSTEVSVFPNGTYEDASGTVISGVSNDLTIVRLLSKHDFALRNDVGGAVVQAVAY